MDPQNRRAGLFVRHRIAERLQVLLLNEVVCFWLISGHVNQLTLRPLVVLSRRSWNDKGAESIPVRLLVLGIGSVWAFLSNHKSIVRIEVLPNGGDQLITKASLISTRNLELAWARITTAKNLQHKRMFRHLYSAYEPGRKANLKLLHEKLKGAWKATSPICVFR